MVALPEPPSLASQLIPLVPRRDTLQVRNYIPSYQQVVSGGWNIADCVERAYDVEGMNVGTVAAGRIGLGVLRRLHPFSCKLHYVDRHRYVLWLCLFVCRCCCPLLHAACSFCLLVVLGSIVPSCSRGRKVCC